MLIAKIEGLKPGTVIPKPEATAEFKIKGWGKRRGEAALTYWIPNHKSPGKPLVKGITVTEFQRAYDRLLNSKQFTRQWFNANLGACASEGACNFTTIGGIFELLGVAHYASLGTYVLDRAIAPGNSPPDFDAMFDEIAAEVREEDAAGKANRCVFDEVMDSADEERKARFKAAIEGLGKLFGPEKATGE